MPAKNYRSYIQAVVSKANQYEAKYSNSMVYAELTQWLKENKIRLDNEMFKAVLNTCNLLKKEYQQQGNASIKNTAEFMSMFFHTYTGEDGLHTDSKLLEKYINDFFPVLQKRMDEEKQYGSIDYRMKSIDVVRLGKLFDAILAKVDDDNAKQDIENLMNTFMVNDLE